ncbi:hypothetical protein HMPREF0208_02056 [Citrobacter koseri]|uniref:Uncharacterized protein n=1 Tax=Citrobacter koseri (strain ATCC BAA-895 / CDC 4225-83 / SGSC4696) TaxID=290338 RepID=A8AFP0_CITK8|nr:hypothetical protein CKO_01162 [Citrobacter koseri ATCC BAA-895]KWZ96552.1 hypothetical protein HMPREF3220_03487 [Citrobacter koseri]KXA00691.1 hypothetical protein HMPREF3207_03348 [Citrobacter koseri]KXB44313.1 hypothetical protein HMPREF0208_02056 [Citrobacter koseri]
MYFESPSALESIQIRVIMKKQLFPGIILDSEKNILCDEDPQFSFHIREIS